MRTVLLANNRLGADVGRYLARRRDLAGVVLHPPTRQSYSNVLGEFDVPVWEWPNGLEQIRAEDPDCLLSVLFAYRLNEAWLELPRWKALNLHPGLLPWNRGAAPNVWPLIDGSPAGTTLHVMEAAIDRGPIVAQEQVPTYADDTAETLYRRLEIASLLLLRRVWPIVSELEPTPQSEGGSFHRLADLPTLDPSRDDLSLIDRLRARTFPPYGAEFERDGHRYRIRVDIERLR